MSYTSKLERNLIIKEEIKTKIPLPQRVKTKEYLAHCEIVGQLTG